MFAEMLLHSQEKIFLEAVDQYFEEESLNSFSEDKIEDIPNENLLQHFTEEAEKNKESNIEIMNFKFYETLNIGNLERRDLSTDVESDDSMINGEKSKIKVSDVLIINKESINELKNKIFDELYEQITLSDKIKAIFSKNETENEKKTKKKKKISKKSKI